MTVSDQRNDESTAMAPSKNDASRRRLPDTAREIAVRIRQLRRRHGRVALGQGIGMAVTALGLWLMSETVTDFLTNLPWLGRLVFAVAGVGGAAAVLWKFGLRRWWRRLPDEAVALMVERALPEFRSRFIAAVQLAKRNDGTSSPELVRALVAETTAMAAQMKFDKVVVTAPRTKWLRAALLALLATAGLAVYGGHRTKPLVLRACLFNVAVPRQTQIDNVSGDRVIAIGDDLRLEAEARGIVPAKGRLRVKTAKGKPQEFDFNANVDQPGHFARVLQSVQEPFDYVVALGDAESASFHVRVKPRPSVASVECQQVWPAYTQLPPQRRPLGDLKILAGSKLVLKVKANTAVKAGEIRLVGADRDKPVKTAPLQPAGADKTLLAGEAVIPAEGVTGMTLQLVDEDGVESRGAAVYHIDVQRDAAPTIKIIWPDRREILLTREATALISFEAKDDFGVAKVKLHYAVDWVENGPHKTLDLDLGGMLAKSVTRRFDWKVGAIVPHVEEGSVIDYWFEVFDANNLPSPGIATTEHYQARIVSDAEKRADLANRLSDAMEGLNSVRRSQEEVNTKLGEIIFETPPESK
ncbi:MAG: DUF4175 domain-containing protein [Chthoniobacter sp.]|nr:DUF4175 domain-containing protein [Chthoniobacter sp.]